MLYEAVAILAQDITVALATLLSSVTMQPPDNGPQDASTSQAVPPKVYAMLVLEDEETEVYVEDAQTVYETAVTRVYLLEGRFTDADLRAWCLEMQTGHVIPINNATIMKARCRMMIGQRCLATSLMGGL